MASAAPRQVLYVRAGGLLFALDAAQVERIVALDQVDAAVVRPGAPPSQVQVGGRWYAVRPLAELFGGQGESTALVLLEVEPEVRVALAVAACLRLAPAPPLAKVPPGVLRRGGDGVLGAFVGGELGASLGLAVGLAVDVGAALGPRERGAIRGELASAAVDDWGPA